jgi:hypothetical protein
LLCCGGGAREEELERVGRQSAALGVLRARTGATGRPGAAGDGAWRPRGEQPLLGMKTDRIRTDITDIVFVFIFMSGFGFEYG